MEFLEVSCSAPSSYNLPQVCQIEAILGYDTLISVDLLHNFWFFKNIYISQFGGKTVLFSLAASKCLEMLRTPEQIIIIGGV